MPDEDRGTLGTGRGRRERGRLDSFTARSPRRLPRPGRRDEYRLHSGPRPATAVAVAENSRRHLPPLRGRRGGRAGGTYGRLVLRGASATRSGNQPPESA